MLIAFVLFLLTPSAGWARTCAEHIPGQVHDTPAARRTHHLFFNERIFIAGDFNGDGRADEAFFAKTGNKYHLVACLGDGRAFRLLETRHISGFYIYRTQPRVYLAACAKGYASGCRVGDLAEVELKYDGIHVFKTSSRIYYWAESGFKVLWTSD